MSEGTPVIVFGAGGRIGRELISGLQQSGVTARGYTRKDANITHSAAVAQVCMQARPAIVINAAGYSDVDEAERDRERANLENARGPAVLAAYTGAEGIPLIHFSSDYVFNGGKGDSYREDDTVAPISTFGASKALGEEAIRSANPWHVILRTAGVFGPSIECFPVTVLRNADAGRQIRAAADLRGSPTPVGQLVSAVVALLRSLESGSRPWGTYNLAGAGGASRHELASAVLRTRERILGVRTTLTSALSSDFRARARRPRDSELDSSLFAATFGEAPGPWRDAIEPFVESYYRSFSLPAPSARMR